MPPNASTKRPAPSHPPPAPKRQKPWRVPHKHSPAPGPQPGDAGIWASCAKGREAKCTAELRDLFTHYARLLYNTHDPAPAPTATIETSIAAELAALRAPSSPPLFVPLRIDVQCLVFFRTAPPVDPVALVRRICVDAARGPRRTRFVQRLAPVTRLARASPEGLRRVAEEVLAPHFHGEGVVGRKFAIRPNLRNHHVLGRDAIIAQVAALVGPPHVVDLKGYELLVTVEVYQNVCGVSVLDDSFERLKRYNLAEIEAGSAGEGLAQSATVASPLR